jgi:hypothetical protein
MADELAAPDLGTASPVLSGGVPDAPLSSPTPPAQPTPEALTGGVPAPTAPTPTPQAAGQQSVWKDLVMGAIYGLSGSAGAKNFGQGLSGGAQGYIQGKQQELQNAQAQQRQNAEIKFQSVQAAHMAAETTMLTKQVNSWDEDHQNQFFDRNLKVANQLKDLGLNPEYATQNDSDSEMAALKDATAKNGGVAPYTSLQVAPNSFLHFNLQQAAASDAGLKVISDHEQRLGHVAPDDATWKGLNSQQKMAYINDAATAWQPTNDSGKLADLKNDLALVQNLPDGAYKKQDSLDTLNKAITASEKLVKSNPSLKDQKAQADLAKTNAGTTKDLAEANKANADADKARADANGQSEWKPKVGADEKKKAELGENIAENANVINGILARRPDLVGKIAGRMTNVEQLSGNNDPDISSIGVAMHNLAMANSSVHGFRSNEGVQDTEKKILNGFKNGPQAVAGALKTNVDSVQTFIDNARPEGYQTHSKQGGALSYYQSKSGAATPPQGATNPVYAKDGKTLIGHVVGGKYVALGAQ